MYSIQRDHLENETQPHIENSYTVHSRSQDYAVFGSHAVLYPLWMVPDTNFMLMEQSVYFNDMHVIQHTKTCAVHTKSAHKYPI